MGCIALASPPSVHHSQSSIFRDCEGSGRFLDHTSGSLMSVSSTSPKLPAMVSVYIPSSPIALPSPRLHSPANPSWSSPLSTPAARSSCHCGGFTSCPSCSCTLASASPIDSKWQTFPDRREFLVDAKASAHSASHLEVISPCLAPQPRLTSPSSRRQLQLDAYSPRFGGCNNLSNFPAKSCPKKTNSGIAIDDPSNKENAGVANSDPWRYVPQELQNASAPKVPEPAERNRLNVGLSPVADKSRSGQGACPPTPPLKRKRPPKLEIAQSSFLVTNMLPNGVDLNEDAFHEVTFEGSYYGIACKKGRREYLEDTQRAIPDLHGDAGQAFFGVFDGHGGRKAADFAAENLVHNILDAMDKSNDSEGYMEAAVRSGYLRTDAEFLQKGVSSGASCVTAIMKDGQMVIANAGDCRAVLSRAGVAEALTQDHRAGREDERNRIEKLGGYVDNLTGTWRVQGILAVSRGIGDLHLKEWISAEPEVQKLSISPECEFLILASDGLWDSVSNQEAVDFIHAVLVASDVTTGPRTFSPCKYRKDTKVDGVLHGSNKGIMSDQILSLPLNTVGEDGDSTPMIEDYVDIVVGNIDGEVLDVGIPETPAPSAGPVAACKRLLDIALERGCSDDITIIIVDLQHFRRTF